MEAVCEKCGRVWELEKPGPEEYEDGPRCPDPHCRSRNIEVPGHDTFEPPETPETDDLPLATKAFRRLMGGAGPAELVAGGVVGDPERAEELAKQYARLSDLVIRSSEEIEKIRQETRERAREEVTEEFHEEIIPKMRARAHKRGRRGDPLEAE